MRKCKLCMQEKDVAEYYASRQTMCKECVKRSALEYRNNNLEKVRAYDRQRGQLEHRKEQNRERNRIYNCLGRQKEWVKANPDKRMAHIIVGNALHSGRLVRPNKCEACNTECTPHGHHEDYAKPLDVWWLCKDCHGKRHREINEERRQNGYQVRAASN